MGARASRRRHEGRAIRKERREKGIVVPTMDRVSHKIDAIAQGFMAFGKAAEKTVDTFSNMFTAFEVGYPGMIAMRDGRDGSVTLGVDPGLPYPTQSGVEDGREALSVAEKVDVTAARLGLNLLPWQRELAIAALDPEAKRVQLYTAGGQRGGKTTVHRVVSEVRGPDASMGWIDETLDLP